jgi:hypothetical protein
VRKFLCPQLANELIEDRAKQDFLKVLPVHFRNGDNGNRYLVGDVAEVNQRLEALFPYPDDPDMDLIMEVETSHRNASNVPMRLTVIRGFTLSQTPRFNQELGKVTGVGKSTGPDGELRLFADIWDSEAIMRRLPAEDIQREDARFHLDCALDKLMQEERETKRICATSSC